MNNHPTTNNLEEELIRDLCSVEFRVKSTTRKRVKQFISDYMKKDMKLTPSQKKRIALLLAGRDLAKAMFKIKKKQLNEDFFKSLEDNL